MLRAALVQAAVLGLLLIAVPRLAGAVWTSRAPWAGVLLWQAGGLAAALLVLEALAALALAPLGATYLAALAALPAPLPWPALAVGGVGVVLALRLGVALLVCAARTLRARHRHRVLVDLVATRNPLLRDTHVVDSALPVAYCLPGLRPRLVVSRGVLTALDEDEVRAVLDHELAHVVQRHDLVVLPFVALGVTFPRLEPVRVAQESVALLVEMLADDRAARWHDARVLARALYKIGHRQVPVGGLSATGAPVLRRAGRLVTRPAPLSWAGTAAALAGAAVLAALPALGLLLPQL